MGFDDAESLGFLFSCKAMHSRKCNGDVIGGVPPRYGGEGGCEEMKVRGARGCENGVCWVGRRGRIAMGERLVYIVHIQVYLLRVSR